MAEAGAGFRHETERLILRDWREEDWPEFWEGTNTPTVARWVGGVLGEAAMAEGRAKLERYARDYAHTFWCVERKEDGAILGFCGLKRCTDEEGPLGEMEAGWRFREDAWGKGYAKEAATASLELAFGRFGAEQVIAMTLKGNRPSWGLMLRLGMKRREDLDWDDPTWELDDPRVIVYAITRQEWRARDV
ncbi:GNAT family N-acetyltransferase [Erythrobacter rubeus]|uniref:GNAT family N-acetyltransferase n=1 Tax=Erythrobacter rubeus TaxID=2760803 RepID=A0ABR8KUZ2_9SPHN|nr:GNAT family N-acetyltransferase [Erythrobacter rubeus]MBD2843232.1 GNAT family N-acetyltransferase [Erythrobacter rubeus]